MHHCPYLHVIVPSVVFGISKEKQYTSYQFFYQLTLNKQESMGKVSICLWHNCSTCSILPSVAVFLHREPSTNHRTPGFFSVWHFCLT